MSKLIEVDVDSVCWWAETMRLMDVTPIRELTNNDLVYEKSEYA